jgi:hypothetical protein
MQLHMTCQRLPEWRTRIARTGTEAGRNGMDVRVIIILTGCRHQKQNEMAYACANILTGRVDVNNPLVYDEV